MTQGDRAVTQRDSANPVWSLFDAAAQHYNIRLDCPRCHHVVVYNAAALWLECQRQGRSDSLSNVRRRYYCHACGKNRRVRPILKLCQTEETRVLPLPSDLEWKQAIRRRR